MGNRCAGQGVSIIEIVGTVSELFASVLEGLGQRSGNTLAVWRSEDSVKLDRTSEHAEDAVVVFSDFPGFLHVPQAGLGVAKIAQQGFIFKEQLIDPGCHVC